MKYILSVAALAFMPVVSFAATFHYVNSEGYTATVEASDANTALNIAPNIAANSGVALDMGLIDPGTPIASVAGERAAGYQNPDTLKTYYYVNSDGYTASVEASNANTALSIAPNIAANSGVANDSGNLEEGTPVPSVAGN